MNKLQQKEIYLAQGCTSSHTVNLNSCRLVHRNQDLKPWVTYNSNLHIIFLSNLCVPAIYKLLTPGKHLGFLPLIELISAAVYLISLLSFIVPPTINSHKATKLSFKNQVFCTPKHF